MRRPTHRPGQASAGIVLLVIACSATWVLSAPVSMPTDGGRVVRVFQQEAGGYHGAMSQPARLDADGFTLEKRVARTLVCDYRNGLLVRFDVDSVPPSDRVVGAVLQLHCVPRVGQRETPVPVVGCHDVTEVDADGRVTIEDYPVSLTTIDSSPAWYGWDVTELAQGWHDGTRENHGILLRAVDPVASSRCFPSSAAPKVGLSPKLLLTTLPGEGEGADVVFAADLATPDAAAWTLGRPAQIMVDGEPETVMEGVMDEGRLRVRSSPQGERFTAGRDTVVRFRYRVSGPGDVVRFLLCGDAILEAVLPAGTAGQWHTVRLRWQDFHGYEGAEKPGELQVRLLNWYLMGAEEGSRFLLDDIRITGSAARGAGP